MPILLWAGLTWIYNQTASLLLILFNKDIQFSV